MKCPNCGGKSAITDGRQRASYYWRRHECLLCGFRFSTKEVYIEDYNKPKAFIKTRGK